MEEFVIISAADYLERFKERNFHGTVTLTWTFYDGQITKIKKGVEENLDKESKQFRELNKM